jgi:hypothetical protein
MNKTTIAYMQAYGRSTGHAGPLRRGHAYRGDLARKVRSHPVRSQRRTLQTTPRLAGVMNKAPRAAAILVAAVLAIDLVRALLVQPIS